MKWNKTRDGDYWARGRNGKGFVTVRQWRGRWIATVRLEHRVWECVGECANTARSEALSMIADDMAYADVMQPLCYDLPYPEDEEYEDDDTPPEEEDCGMNTRIEGDNWFVEIRNLTGTWTVEIRRGSTGYITHGHPDEAAARKAALADIPEHWTEVGGALEASGAVEWKECGGSWHARRGRWHVVVYPAGGLDEKWIAAFEETKAGTSDLSGVQTWPFRTIRGALDSLHTMCAAWAPADALEAMKSEVPT